MLSIIIQYYWDCNHFYNVSFVLNGSLWKLDNVPTLTHWSHWHISGQIGFIETFSKSLYFSDKYTLPIILCHKIRVSIKNINVALNFQNREKHVKFVRKHTNITIVFSGGLILMAQPIQNISKCPGTFRTPCVINWRF